MNQITQHIHAISPIILWFLVIVFGLISILLIFKIIPNLIKSICIVKNTRISKIFSAKEGYIKLAGKAYPLLKESLTSPLSNTPCCYYEYKIQRWETHTNQSLNLGSGARKRERVSEYYEICSGKSDNFFLIDDETGKCIISPYGSDIMLEKTKTWTSNTLPPSFLAHKDFQKNAKIFNQEHPEYKFSETLLIPGKSILVTGFFNSYYDTDKDIFSTDSFQIDMAKVSRFSQKHSNFYPAGNLIPVIKNLNDQWNTLWLSKNVFSEMKLKAEIPLKINLLSGRQLNDTQPYIITDLASEGKLLNEFHQRLAICIGIAVIFGIVSVIMAVGKLCAITSN